MRLLLLVLIALATTTAKAAHHCVGKVNNVDVDAGANVHVNIAGVGDGNSICALNRKAGLYEAEACKAVLSLLLSAKMGDKKIRMYFQNDTNTNCAKGDWLDFSSPNHALYYIRLED